MPNTARTLLVAFILGASGGAAADTLLVEGLEVAAASSRERPARGLSMAGVEERFGTPESRSGPVGEPPITRWDDPGFIVFFEHRHVIHSVRRPASAQ